MPQKREHPAKGTHYSPRDQEQRSYFLPPGLGDAFRDFNHSHASMGARGAFILWMACDNYSDLRERAIRAADQMTIEEAVKTIREHLKESVARDVIHEYVKSLPQPEQARLLQEARRKVSI